MTTRRPRVLYTNGIYPGVGSGVSDRSDLGSGDKDKPVGDSTLISSLHPVHNKHRFLMQSDGGGEEASSSEVSSSLQTARTSLEELRLDDAEQQFLHTFRLAQEKSADVTCLVTIYTGLAEVCTRRSRSYRQNPLEWLWLCVHGGALLGEAVRLCQAGLDTEPDNQTRDWLSAQHAFAAGRSQNLADVVGRTLLNWLREDWRLINPFHALNRIGSRTPLTPSHYPLTGVQMGGMKPYHANFLTHGFSLESLESLHEPPARMLGNHFSHSNWFQRIQLYCHRRLHGNDVKAILREILSFEENLDSDKPDQKLEPETISEESESVLNDSMDLGDVDELSKTDTPVREYSLSFELASSKVDQTGWDFFLEQRKDYVVDSVIQMVPSSEGSRQGQHTAGRGEQGGEEENGDEVVEEEEVEEQEKEMFSPLPESRIKLMMGKIYHRLVDHLIAAESYTQAELLCENILEIVDEIQDGSSDLLRFSAQVLQNTGLLCLRQGLINKGRLNFEKALRLFQDLQDHDAHREVAIVLIDLGNAYVSEALHEDTLYAEVIAAICEFFEKEAADEQDEGSRPERVKDKPLEPKNRNSMGNVDAAISCYTEALSVLENNEETQKDIVAKALRKLGDCHFMQKSYPEALVFYEKALGLFRLAGVYGKESILENAHVLIMLGVSTFMLHVYPRAAHVFELAMHMVKHAFGLTLHTFLHGLLLSLLGITFYKMKSYHRCVSFCSQAFETFWTVYEEKITELPQQKFWLVCQNLYMLGNTYNILNLQHKAIKFLNIGRLFMQESCVGEHRQHMRILQILGDCYFAQYDYKTALTYYNEALEIGDRLTTSQSESEMSRSGSGESGGVMVSSSEDLDMALHNQLLSRSADAHISMKQYQSAVHYLEQARDIQDVLEEDIKGDLVSTLHQLGQMHTMAGHIDKSIESYRESLDVFREMHQDLLGPEMCVTLGNLATMCYVKACICEDIDQELDMILATEQYFQESLKLEINQSVCVKYANFLYSQANYEDAVLYLQDALKADDDQVPDIVYGGLEKVTLPEALQDQVEAQEEVLLPSMVLAHYLLLLAHKQLGEMRHAEESLLHLLHEVYTHSHDSPFLQAVLGLALMEMGVFREAALHFRLAWGLDPEFHLALDNYCLCLCLDVFSTLQRALASIFVGCGIWQDDEAFDQQLARILQAAENIY